MTTTRKHATMEPANIFRWMDGDRVRHVTVYEVTLQYGGPEEGGWWYNYYHPVLTRSVRDNAHAARVAEVLAAQHLTPTPHWSSDTSYMVRYESRRYEHRTTRRPHYE